MKVLLDACLSPLAQLHLESAGHNVVSAADWDKDPGDAAILARAHQEGRVLVTLDKDFGELGVLRQTPHCGIIRLVNLRAAHQGPVVADILSRHADELARGAIVTVEPGRVRIRPADRR